MTSFTSQACSPPGPSRVLASPSSDWSPQATASSLASTKSLTMRTSRQAASLRNHKRRCISTACIAYRKRKSKCDGALPSCAACASVYGTQCIYDPNSDHRRKGVYRERPDSVKARGSTLEVIFKSLLNVSEDELPKLVRRIRTCDNFDLLTQDLLDNAIYDSAHVHASDDTEYETEPPPLTLVAGETDLARKMGELRVKNGSVRFIGGTSHLIYLGDPPHEPYSETLLGRLSSNQDPITSWTRVTTDARLVLHLIDMYFSYHYAYFTTLSKKLFLRDFHRGAFEVERDKMVHCSPLLVNAMLVLGCHFTDIAGAYDLPGNSRTKGNHFFAEAKRLFLANDEFAKPQLTTVQALALMSVREAGCARESQGWVYSGMSFRMAQDLGLNLEMSGAVTQLMSEEEIDARKITFWGCFVFDKCWSNYLGRLPQLPRNSFNVSKFDIIPDEDAATWSPPTDRGPAIAYQQPWRTITTALLLSSLRNQKRSPNLLLPSQPYRQISWQISRAQDAGRDSSKARGMA